MLQNISTAATLIAASAKAAGAATDELQHFIEWSEKAQKAVAAQSLESVRAMEKLTDSIADELIEFRKRAVELLENLKGVVEPEVNGTKQGEANE